MHEKKRSVQGGILFGLLIFIIPFLLFLVCYNIYNLNVMHKMQIQVGKNNLNTYVDPIEDNLMQIEGAMVKVMANDGAFYQMVHGASHLDVYVSSDSVIKNLGQALIADQSISGILVYDHKYDIIKEKYLFKYSFSQKESFREFLRKQPQRPVQMQWGMEEIGGKKFLCRVLQKKDSFLMLVYDLGLKDTPQDYDSQGSGFLFFADQTMNPVTEEERVKTEGLILQGKCGREYFITGKDTKYLVVQREMEYGGARALYAAPYYGMIKSADQIPAWFLLASLLILALMFVSFRQLHVYFLRPMKLFMGIMMDIKQGNLDARMPESSITEFDMLSRTFNEMMEQIKWLDAVRYQEQFEAHQAKLQYLQAQIRPHFYINCLKNLYSLIENERYLQTQEAILALSGHIRYMFRDNLKLVTVEQELQGVRNYLSLQQIMTARDIQCDIEVEERLGKYLIPTFSLLSFVENSVKFGRKDKKKLLIGIKISVFTDRDKEFINITVLDNGPGFSKENLEGLNKKCDFSYHSAHVGIENIRHRLWLLYKEEGTVIFSNIEGSGACVQIFLPSPRLEEQAADLLF